MKQPTKQQLRDSVAFYSERNKSLQDELSLFQDELNSIRDEANYLQLVFCITTLLSILGAAGFLVVVGILIWS